MVGHVEGVFNDRMYYFNDETMIATPYTDIFVVKTKLGFQLW